MTDEEILDYLRERNFRVHAHDGVDLFNGSYQIKHKFYDDATGTMTVITPNNIFTFDWVLGDGTLGNKGEKGI